MTANQLYLEAETYSNKFLELCDPIKQFLDLDNVAYYEVNSDGSATSIHSSYKWMEEYIAGEHYLEDPHMVHPSNMHKGFCIILVNNKYNYQKYNDLLLYDNKNKALFGYGFTYILKNKLGFTAFCFTTNKSNYIINRVINEIKTIKLFVQKLDNKVKELLKNQPQLKINLSKLKGERFFNQKGIIFSD